MTAGDLIKELQRHSPSTPVIMPIGVDGEPFEVRRVISGRGEFLREVGLRTRGYEPYTGEYIRLE